MPSCSAQRRQPLLHLRIGLAGQHQRQKDVVLERKGVQQVELLEHEAQVVPAEGRHLRLADLAQGPCRPAARSPPVGRSSAARMLSSVVLPEPDSPMMATYSPSSTREVDVSQRLAPGLPPKRVRVDLSGCPVTSSMLIACLASFRLDCSHCSRSARKRMPSIWRTNSRPTSYNFVRRRITPALALARLQADAHDGPRAGCGVDREMSWFRCAQNRGRQRYRPMPLAFLSARPL